MNSEKPPFDTGDLVVYPTHGVGKIVAIETQEISGYTLSVFVVHFDKDRMTLRVPLGKAKVSGLRRLSSHKEMDAALAKLRGRSRAKRTMWSRRAQEYQAKIASGDPGSIAEVVRDLYRNAGQPEQSYSERQIYQAALDRVCRSRAHRRDHRNPAGRTTADRLNVKCDEVRAAPRSRAIWVGRKICPVAGRRAGLGSCRHSW
jgi:CarD family transcriptional regulator